MSIDLTAQERVDQKAAESRKAAKADPAMLRQFLRLTDSTSDEMVKMIAEADAAAVTLQGEYQGARVRARQLREGQEKLTPDGSLPFMPFPVEEVFAEPLANFVRTQEASIGCDAAAIALPVIGQMAAGVGNSHRVEVIENNWYEPSTVWVFNLGKSGTHKSVVQRAALKPMKKWATDAYDEYAFSMESYDNTLAEWSAKPPNERKDKPTPPVCQRYAVNDITIEAHAIIQSENPHGVPLARPEGSGWLKGMGQYKKGGGGEMLSWIEFWDGDEMTIDRKTGTHRTVHIPAPCTTVISGTQPGALRRDLTAEHFDSGFAPRLLLCEPPTRPRRFTCTPVSTEVWYEYHAAIDGLYARPDGGRPIPFSPEAEVLWERYYNTCADAIELIKSDRLRAAFVKLETYCARFALILHLLDVHLDGVPPNEAPPPISFDAMRRAVILAVWWRHETARLYDKYGFAGFANSKFAEKADELPEVFTARDVEDVWNVQRAQSFKIIKGLVRDGIARQDQHGEYRKETVDFGDFGDFAGVRIDTKALLAGLGANSLDSLQNPQSTRPEIETEPEPLEARQNGSHEAPAGDGVSTDEPAFVWDADDQEGEA